MKLETKRALLMYKLLSSRDFCPETYKILKFCDLDDAINNINEDSFYFDIKVINNQISAEHFLNLLDYLIQTLKLYLYNTKGIISALETIVRCNKDLVNEYLILPNKLSNEEDKKIINEYIYKIFISNFIYNGKSIDMVIDFLNDNNITIKEINSYTFEELKAITDLLSDLVFCQMGAGKVYYLFYNITDELETWLNTPRVKNSKKHNEEEHRQIFLKSYKNNYKDMIKAFNVRKKYLKCFRKPINNC